MSLMLAAGSCAAAGVDLFPYEWDAPTNFTVTLGSGVRTSNIILKSNGEVWSRVVSGVDTIVSQKVGEWAKFPAAGVGTDERVYLASWTGQFPAGDASSMTNTGSLYGVSLAVDRDLIIARSTTGITTVDLVFFSNGGSPADPKLEITLTLGVA